MIHMLAKLELAWATSGRWLPFVLLVVGIFTDASAWIETTGIPTPSEGDIVFYADVATFRGDSEFNIEEVFFVVPNEEIRFVEEDGKYKGKLEYRIEVTDPATGETVTERTGTLDVEALSLDDALSRTIIQVFESSLRVPPGTYDVQVRLKDLNAIKKAILHYLFRKHKEGQVEIRIESSEFPNDGVSISDIEFARSLSRKQGTAFYKSGFEVIPNAPRRYGLLLPELAIYFEVYNLTEESFPDSITIAYSIVNKFGKAIFSKEHVLKNRGEILGNTALFDITSLSAGNYMLRLEVKDSQGRVLASSQRKFDVAWSVLSWGRYESETIEDMTYILTEEEMTDFEKLSPGEREHFLKELWLELDPTPGTLENEALEEYYRRVTYADRHFGAGTRGALTDRGRIYIKYGPPDDVQSFYSDYEFVQGTREIEGGSTPVPTDPFSRIQMQAGTVQDAEGWARTGSEKDAHLDQRGGRTVHGKAYEIWTYEGAGKPIRRLSKRVPTTPQMKFIFVDEKGIGEYRLIYSTEKHEY